MTTSGAPGAAAEAVQELREIAHWWTDGRRGDPDHLIQAALRALIAGVETPSLPLLAGLLRSEQAQASELFGQVADELGFGFHPPEDYWEGRLALARWWAAEIVGGWLAPLDGAELIVENVAEAYGQSEELAPMVDAVRALQDYGGPRFPDDIPAHLTRAAHELLARIPPPSTPS
ncbi:hypothetical protein AB0451_34085 [Streptomyces sp. NPDC052000]|uniref:hypothetical protein n=1 Tax=Streptomyces sp. NPDC052000 TaxID=3155676 RepID=UPI00344E77A2